MVGRTTLHRAYGECVPYGDPSWYQSCHSPYYTDAHVKFRNAVRQFVDEEIIVCIKACAVSRCLDCTDQRRVVV